MIFEPDPVPHVAACRDVCSDCASRAQVCGVSPTRGTRTRPSERTTARASPLQIHHLLNSRAVNCPYPIYFVHRRLQDWPGLAQAADADLPVPDNCAAKFTSGPDCWITQTYIHLKRRGNDVRLVSEIVPGQINVVYYDEIVLKLRPDRAFIVAIQPDRPRPGVADIRITQNQLQVEAATDHYMVHWPQPGLQPREASRGSRLERIGYLGLEIYLDPRLRDDPFRKRLADLGVELIIRERDWTNYRDLDAVLAVRHVSPFDLSIKPPSKMINAWRAGCPGLLGAEPAFQQLRISDLDYLEVRTPDQAIEAVRKLKADPSLYEAMIAHGRQRAEEFSIDRLTTRWEEILHGPAAQAYERWRRQPRLLHLARFALRAINHKRLRRKFKRLIRN